MSKTKSVGDKLASLNALRDDLSSPDVPTLLRQSLADQSNYVVERTAELIAEAGSEDFVASLVESYRRLKVNPLKRDPGCVGKTAIVRALVRLEHDDPEFYRDGIIYEQPEPKWGGQKDTAAELRGLSAAGLIRCASSLEVLNRCAVLLADRCVEARTGAAQAIAALAQPEGAPLLRLKLLTGDPSPEVIGECCSALLRLAPDDGLQHVVQLLSLADGDVCVQAGLALGESRHPDAFEPLRLAWERQGDLRVRESLLLCIGVHRSSEARDFLLKLIASGDLRAAADSVRALKVHGGSMRPQVESAVKATRNPRLATVFEEEWGEEQQ
jgi:HEAT repeat protein